MQKFVFWLIKQPFIKKYLIKMVIKNNKELINFLNGGIMTDSRKKINILILNNINLTLEKYNEIEN